MKKSAILISVILTGNIFNSSAQNFYLGINGGFLKNATIVKDYSPFLHLQPSIWKKERLNSFTWGINAGYELSKHWSIETQFQFVNLGYYERLEYFFHPSNTPGGWLDVEIDWYNYHHYFRIPLLANYNFLSNNSKFGISILAGPNFGFQTKQTTKYAGLNEISRNLATKLDDQEIPLNKLDFGFQLGLRFKTQLYKSFSIFAEGNIYQGFPSIINYPEKTYKRPYEYYEDLNIVNRHITTTIGIQYNFTPKRHQK